ncbi:MAG: tryptophan 7-halogenase [Flavobacteriales bacterium]|nr:tryptophan 7-halogenase [Flavobacteriales bacterium]
MEEFDVVIIGGGPAGSAMASYLAKEKVKVGLFEKEIFPRHHVGESLVPSCNRVFEELGLLPKLEAANFPKKFGAAWTTYNSSKTFDHDWNHYLEADADIRFDERKQEGVNLPYTYHVNRSKFDQLLLHHAKDLGAKIVEGADVFDVKFQSPKEVIVSVRLQDQTEQKVSAKLVVDASGRRTFLGSKLNLKVKDKVFDQCAFHCWFSNFNRNAFEKSEYIYIHFIPVSNSWIWQIPIDESTTSFGVVTQKKNFPATSADREKFFWECVSTRPELEAELRKATQSTDFKVEADYSYAITELTGNNFLMIGDAARFVDPIFSSGVSVALNSARFAAKDIIEALRTGDFNKSSFENYELTIRKGISNWYTFIGMYYRLNVMFTYFVNHPKYRLQVLKFLQGDVYDDSHQDLIREMEAMVHSVESNPNHPLHNHLGSLTAGRLKI